MNQVTVIGGVAFEICGIPKDICRLRNSNPGKVRITVSGIGHNIAKFLKGYGTDVQLITAIGSDLRGELIEKECRSLGIGFDYVMRQDTESAAYVRVYDDDFNLLTGINEMDIIDQIPARHFKSVLPAINQSDLCVIDSNISMEALTFLAENVTVPLFYEPVSVAKAKRIGMHLSKCFSVKANRFEAAQLSGCSCDTIRGAYRAAEWLLAQGIKKVFITLGSEGILYASEEDFGHVEGIQVDREVSSAGAGDCVSAAIVHSLLTGASIREAAEAGNAAGAEFCRTDHFGENYF
ncbi:MAG: bifunctional hydroxymethylpyrimidine kinase/phosphomethylpyrimidine kinase [Clostridia bacterium]|nr:bifunctional hydroxymethylpyrimidine kinase/phosphomethylpyrimidine kinase [Clostridia bacterium]